MKTKIKKIFSWIGDNYYSLAVNILLFVALILVFRKQELLSFTFILLAALVAIMFHLEAIISHLGTLLWILLHSKDKDKKE